MTAPSTERLGELQRMLNNLDELKRNTVVSSHRDAIDEIAEALRAAGECETAKQPPAEQVGTVLAFDRISGLWDKTPATVVTQYPSLFTHWRPLPPPPGGGE